MHKKEILHRDIKPENILLQQTKKGSLKALISDFGTAAKATVKESEEMGTPAYVAPEVAACSLQSTIETILKQDVWSVGMVLYKLLNKNRHPDKLQELIDQKIYPYRFFWFLGRIFKLEQTIFHHNISSFQPSEEITEHYLWSLQILTRKMLTVNPKERLAAQEAFTLFLKIRDEHEIYEQKTL